ncbi:hypothetical protein F0345_29010 (plasmid) [Streptomyces rutgersensis]|uniref:Ferredoxin n=1 Tax=Streptomyces rutgersensis TaxID=53451 RepID=A0ABX6S2I6_9ACTN|nr:hypothetical protein [Streptomyces rutgersensis]QNE85119.1 hypothetical protein F0345_29010 [Streptomyces rutgersensis]
MSTDSATAALYAQALQSTATVPSRCTVPWGVCPEHGGTLKSRARATEGFDSWCTNPVCFNVWPYDRLDAACTEPATHTIQADGGDRYVVCDGHAQITDGQVLPGLPA